VKENLIRALKLAFVSLLVASATGAGLFYWDRMHSVPQFSGPRAQLRAQLWKFEHALTPMERMAAAVAVQDTEPGWSAELSEHEAQLKKKADRLLEETRDTVLSWEARLTREDVNQMTEGNPNSIYRRVGWLRSIPVQCSEQDYRNLRARVDLRELNERSYLVTQWIAQAEAPFEQEYARRRIEYLRDEKYWAKRGETPEEHHTREWVAAWFSAGADQLTSSKPSIDSLFPKPQLSAGPHGEAPITIIRAAPIDYGRQLESTGIERAQIYDTILSYAAMAPDCLIGVHPEFVHRLRAEVTIERGKALLAKLASWIGETGQVDATFSDLPLDRSDSLFGSASDAWGRAYLFKKGLAGGLRVFSQGENPALAQDLIFVGEIQLPQ
jgi:hypothetical protein